jgi:hypothetical protein
MRLTVTPIRDRFAVFQDTAGGAVQCGDSFSTRELALQAMLKAQDRELDRQRLALRIDNSRTSR